ncbi:MAG TPA: hypothetical protein VND22_01395 [Actinomycetota bacterium]|nr:hypothetical protein [Actinomycetota bacterium]
MQLFDRSGRSLTLSPAFSVGGEGSIHRVATHPESVAKIYPPGRVTDELVRKLAVMAKNPPEDPTWSVRKHRSIAWVTGLVYRDPQSRSLAGFIMPSIDTDLFKQAHTYFDTTDRVKRFGGSFTWKHLLIAASNIASAVAAVHARGHRVGDLRDTNVLVSPNALCSLIDCDSFHIVEPVTKQVFPTRVGTSEFLPPELQSADFRSLSVDRYESDLFGLGVLIFKLLMLGTHPFQAKGPAVAELPSTESKILAGTYPHEGRKGLRPPEFSPPIDVLPPAIRALAARCFVKGHSKPMARPDAEEWASAMRREVSSLKTCKSNQHHVFGGHLRACPWCRFARSKPDPFPPQLNIGGQTATNGAVGPDHVDARKRRLASHVVTALSDGPLSRAEHDHIAKLGAELALSNAQVRSVIRECERLAPRPPSAQAVQATAVATKSAPTRAAPRARSHGPTRTVDELKRLLERRSAESSARPSAMVHFAVGSLAAAVAAAAWLIPLAVPASLVLLVLPCLALYGERRGPERERGWAALVPRFLQNVMQSLYFFVPVAWWAGLPLTVLTVALLLSGGPTGLVIRAVAALGSVAFATWILVLRRDEPFLRAAGRGWERVRMALVQPRSYRMRIVYLVAIVAVFIGYLGFQLSALWWPLESEPFS